MLNFDFTTITSMSVTDRISLVEAIWDSIAAEQENLPITDEQRQELDDRIAEMDVNPDAGSTWDEVKARLCNGP